MAKNLDIGILSCTFFEGSWWSGPANLPAAYRPPALFASAMRQAGHRIEFLYCDEEFQLKNLDGSARRLQDSVDILYVMTHGEFTANSYRVVLNKEHWLPSVTGIGDQRLSVVIFDTCYLIDPAQDWSKAWQAKIGPNLRLIHGFEGPAAIDNGTALRGSAFATGLVGGKTFADAWKDAVHSMVATRSQYSKGITIGIGDDEQDADDVLKTATLGNMKGPRSSATPYLKKYGP